MGKWVNVIGYLTTDSHGLNHRFTQRIKARKRGLGIVEYWNDGILESSIAFVV